MKILIFLNKWAGGVGVVVKSIKKELEKMGHEVICISREDDLKCYSSTGSLFWLRKKYKEIIIKETPDIIYTQDWSMALPLVFPFSFYKEKHFCCFHGNQFYGAGFVQKIIGEVMGKKLIVVGDSLERRFHKANKIYNGVELELFKPNKKIGKIKNSVGFVNWRTKAYRYDEIKMACEELGKKLVVAENVPYEEMPKFYQKLECFISLAPKGAGFNMSWIEAMACGVPKIIGNNEGVGERLNIDKIGENEPIVELINRSRGKDYRKEIKQSDLTWKNHVDKLLKVWK